MADAAVIGVTIDGDEHPRAYIVRAADKIATEKDIQDFIKKQTTRTKWLTGGVRFVDVIPKNPVSEPFHFKQTPTNVTQQSGKILRKVLRDQAKEEQERARL